MNPDTPPTYIKSTLKDMLAGYVGITDTWGAAMTVELLEMYPDAIVICTTRDEASWWKSWTDMMANAPPPWVAQIMLAPVPCFRYFPNTSWQAWRKWVDIFDLMSHDVTLEREPRELADIVRLSKVYGFNHVEEPKEKGKCISCLFQDLSPYWFGLGYITVHNEWLKRTVPPSKIHFFSVKEGWEPLCKILNVPVPDEPFPRANEQAAMKELSDRIMAEVMWRWGGIIGATAVGIAAVVIGVKYFAWWKVNMFA